MPYEHEPAANRVEAANAARGGVEPPGRQVGVIAERGNVRDVARLVRSDRAADRELPHEIDVQARTGQVPAGRAVLFVIDPLERLLDLQRGIVDTVTDAVRLVLGVSFVRDDGYRAGYEHRHHGEHSQKSPHDHPPLRSGEPRIRGQRDAILGRSAGPRSGFGVDLTP